MELGITVLWLWQELSSNRGHLSSPMVLGPNSFCSFIQGLALILEYLFDFNFMVDKWNWKGVGGRKMGFFCFQMFWDSEYQFKSFITYYLMVSMVYTHSSWSLPEGPALRSLFLITIWQYIRHICILQIIPLWLAARFVSWPWIWNYTNV